MGADWNHPQIGDAYVAVLTTHLMGRDVDALTLQKTAPSNLPDGAIAYDRATDLFKEWNSAGAAFVTKVLSLAGGGTGGSSAAGARASLGLGSMAVQDSTAVAITGGAISGITLDASVLTTGIVALARGGTGATLAIGAAGEFLQSVAGAVAFGHDGSNLNNLNASNINSGTISAARLPAGVGTIRQIISTETSTRTDNLTTVFADVTNLQATITPQSVANKVRIRLSLYWSAVTRVTGGDNYKLQVLRNAAVIYTTNSFQILNQITAGSPSVYGGITMLEFDDTPASVVALTYKVQIAIAIADGTADAIINGSATPGSKITLEEWA